MQLKVQAEVVPEMLDKEMPKAGNDTRRSMEVFKRTFLERLRCS